MDNPRDLRKGYQPSRASTKLLRGFAISLAQKFETSYEYLMGGLWADHRCRTFQLDLLTGKTWPKTCKERRNRILTDKIVGNWAYLQMRFPHVRFTRAELVSRWLEPQADARWTETRVTSVAGDDPAAFVARIIVSTWASDRCLIECCLAPSHAFFVYSNPARLWKTSLPAPRATGRRGVGVPEAAYSFGTR